MKNINLLFLSFFFINVMDAALFNIFENEEFICNEIATFHAPSQQNFDIGDDVYVRIKFNDKRFVHSVKLYIGHQPIRIDNTAPYEWGLPNGTNDSQLRNMPAGNYALTAEVRYACGNKRTFKKIIKVGSSRFVIKTHNPIYSLAWLSTIHKAQPNSKIIEFRKGSTTYYKVQPCRTMSSYTKWYDLRGILKGRFRSNKAVNPFRYATLVKKWYDPCR